MTDTYIFDALRTPRAKGKPSGALYEVKPVDLLATAFRALANRTNLPTEAVSDAIIGCVTPVDGQGFNIAKAGLLHAGWADSVSGLQINRYCTSGLEAVNLAHMKIAAGAEEMVVAGGIESMSRIPIGTDGGALLEDPEVISRNNYLPQGVAADLIATLENFSREDIDAYAEQSQLRAKSAMENGYFDKSIIPVFDQNGLTIVTNDEHPRSDTTLEKLLQLPPAFAKFGAMGFEKLALQKYPEVERIQHVHTAGNSSGIVDGAALILLAQKEKGEELGLRPRAKIRATGMACVDPTIMLTGPTVASQKALQKAGMTAKDVDLWECNEAFASVVLKFQRDMQLDDAVLNVNGGAIAFGHPLGATGAMLLNILLDELERRDLQTGLVTLCAGGGIGVATIIERV